MIAVNKDKIPCVRSIRHLIFRMKYREQRAISTTDRTIYEQTGNQY